MAVTGTNASARHFILEKYDFQILVGQKKSGSITSVMGSVTVIEYDPDKLGGVPVFRGTRVPVRSLFDYVEAGDRLDEFLEDFPTVSREAAVAALELAKAAIVTTARDNSPR